MQNSIIFTGELRKPALFRQTLSDLKKLKTDGLIKEIVYVIWQGSLKQYCYLNRDFNELGVEIIEAVPALQGGVGNVWHQMKAFEIALKAIPSNRLVLKTRPDLYISQELIRKLLTGEINLDIDESTSMPDIFLKKVWIPWFEISKPFYMADECFFGLQTDISKFCNFDSRFDVLFKVDSARTHIRRYILPFLNQFPLLNTYLEYYGQSYHDTKDYKKFIEQRLLSAVYPLFLVVYYRILAHYFNVLGNAWDMPVFFRDWLPPTVVAPQKVYKSRFNIKYSWGLNRIYDYNLQWINDLLGQNIKENSKELTAFYSALDLLEYLGNFNYSPDTEEIKQDTKIERAIFG